MKVAYSGNEVDLKGSRQIFTPDITSMLAVQYDIQIGNKKDIRLFTRGEWKYLGNQYFDLANTIKQDQYSLFNSSFGITFKTFSIGFWGRT